MASKLLNVLNKIETGRRAIITKANLKNYALPSNASLKEISNVFNVLPTTDGKIIGIDGDWNINAIRSLLINRAINLPAPYNTFLNTFKQLSLDSDGYYPAYMVVINNTADTTIFKAPAQYSPSTPTADNTVVIGSDRATNYGTYLDYKVITSDDSTYTFIRTGTELTETHTWDQSKDINGLRYFIVYLKMQTGGSMTTLLNTYNAAHSLKINKLAVTAFFGNVAFTDINFTNSQNTSFKDTLKYICMLDLLNADYQTIRAHYVNKGSGIPQFYCYVGGNYTTVLQSLIIDSELYSNYPYIYSYTPHVNFILYVTKEPMYIRDVQATYYKISDASIIRLLPLLRAPNDDYFKNYIYNESGLYLGYSSTTPHRFMSHTDAIITNITEDFEGTNILGNESNTTNPAWLNAAPLNSHDVIIPEHITRLGAFAFYGACANQALLDLNNITSIVKAESLSECFASVIQLNNLTTLSYSLFDYIYCKVLQLNSLTNTTAKIGNYMNGALELDMESIEEYLFEFPYSRTLEVINVPNLKRSVTKPFNITDSGCEWSHLHTLIIGENYETSLNISECRALSLSCILDIINKLKDYSESTDTHTLTLPKLQYAVLTNEQIAVATAKGWTVTFA